MPQPITRTVSRYNARPTPDSFGVGHFFVAGFYRRDLELEESYRGWSFREYQQGMRLRADRYHRKSRFAICTTRWYVFGRDTYAIEAVQDQALRPSGQQGVDHR